MDDYKKIPFDDLDLCVPDLDDFDQMKEFFLDCAAEYFRYLSSDDMEKMLAALGKRVDVLATPTDDVFISVSPDAVLRQYGIQCSEYLDFGYDVDASLSGMLSPHAVLEPRPNTPYVFRRAGFDNLPFIYTQRHLRNAIAPKEADNHQHGLTIEQIKSLPEKLEEPVVVFDQPNYTVNGRSFEGKGVAAVLDMYDPDGVPVIAYFFPNGYGTKTNDNGCSNVIASLYGRDNFTSYLARAANEEKILYIDSEKYEQMEKELPRYGGTRFPPALAALSMDIIIPSSYICKMKAEINPKLSDREREHNSLNRTMHIKVADSRRNRLAQDRDKPRNITPRYDDDSHDSQ